MLRLAVTLHVLWPTVYVRMYVCMYVAPVLQYYYKYTGFPSQIFM